MRRLISGIRLLLLIALTAPLYAVKLLLSPLRLVSERNHRAVRRLLFALWARGAVRVIGLKVTRQGPLPRRPFVLVANHLSYVDIILLARHLNVVFVAKADLASWPVAGPIIASVDTIFVDRERKRDLVSVNRRIAAALDAGEGVVLFPEGTSSDGEQVLKLMPSLLGVAADNGWPVWHAGITYRTPQGELPASQVVSYFGDDAFGPHLLRLLEVPKIEAHLRIGATPLHGADRKDLARRLRDAIIRQRRDAFPPPSPSQPATSMRNARSLCDDNIAFLSQGKALLEQIDDALYRRTDPPLHDSHIGAHIRHVIDHYDQLLDGLHAARVDYDLRAREPRIESDRGHAIATVAALIGRLQQLRGELADRSLLVYQNGSDSSGPRPNATASTLGRELQFLISHTVHHYALIAFILRSAEVNVPDGFGVSPSTLLYQSARARHAAG
jgi:1-acyl-sn-glycerol-3-phosphate acyltransferase